MKKTIKILTAKIDHLRENMDGTLEGGFSAIKGGFNMASADDGTNDFICTNSKDCTKSTNITGCTNSGTCFL